MTIDEFMNFFTGNTGVETACGFKLWLFGLIAKHGGGECKLEPTRRFNSC